MKKIFESLLIFFLLLFFFNKEKILFVKGKFKHKKIKFKHKKFIPIFKELLKHSKYKIIKIQIK